MSASDSAQTSRVLVELCVDDLEGALVADREGADRIELCADLLEGGTTPSMGTILAVLDAVERVGVQIIVRPRGGDFVYSEAEVDVMCRDLRAIAGAASGARTPVGVVVGALTTAGEVDAAALRRLIDAAAPLPVTFHKAFDATSDLLAAYDVLAAAGVERVLTSGGPHPALQGVEVLAELVRWSRADAAAPTVLVGGSVRPANVREILDATGATEVHLRAQTASPRGDGTLRTDPDVVRDLFAALENPATDTLSDASVVIAVDIGGTNLKGAIVDASGRTIASRSVGVGATGDESIARIIELLQGLRAHTEQSGHHVVGIGVVTPGMVEAENGIVRYASTLDWTDVPLGPILSAELGVPVEIGHDVRSSGLAESLFGASKGVANSVLVAIGTGVAASILSGGHPVVGAVTTAGELGHIPAIPDGEPCTCGQHGCLEVYLSGAGIARRYAAAGGEPGLDAAAISVRLGHDPVADRVWADGVHALALGLKSVTLLIDPAVIVLAGGVSRAGGLLLDPLRAELAQSLVWREAPEIRVSELGTAGGRIGAAVLAFRASGHGEVVDRWTTADVLAEEPRA
ncbi:copper homeostasis protein CutC [Okibacterium fritillariae]|uniref:PF03932 family protein CutC n=1 Tax=Okibacterium fritillariae TaxID=123320 RepID=A0A1T5IET1_9MICO|nr:copper homeostasis protein CutC [Okibacterium fritillariae]SKC37674.1 Copper homeostasis protein CutC [Okibacterium fritillariae]